MMRIAEARRKLAKLTQDGSWMLRVKNFDNRYRYEAGVGCLVLAKECFSPEQCMNLASLNWDLAKAEGK